MAQNIEQFGEVFETDVLVVGGGLAGNNAAIGAAEKGAKVLIADKSSINRCGAIAGGCIRSRPPSCELLAPLVHRAMVVRFTWCTPGAAMR